jgi:lipocalin-like protein
MTILARITSAAAAALSLCALVAPASAQVDQNLIGAWNIVAITYQKDGKTTEPYGPNVKGTQVFGADGRFAVVVTSGDLPKVASNNRETATAEESQKIVHGSIAYFGSYSTNAADHSVTVNIEGATFANWIGTSQKRTYVISGDEMKLLNPTASGGGSATVLMKRAVPKAM